MLGKKIKKIAESKRILFTTPSHDRTAGVCDEAAKYLGRKFFKHDLSEINDLDNLANPTEDILLSMKKSAELLGVKELFYLVNGSSSGIIAAMLAVLKPNDKVLIARNCHKSVLHGLVLTGAEPVWFMPEINEQWSIFNAVSADVILSELEKNSDIKAVIITSPTYEGVTSDIKAISEVCRLKNVKLIVDEAHGALKSFAPTIFGENAVKLGADIAVESLHKTCGAPNPCAILLSAGTISRDKIQNSLNLINTTSPSYPMLAAIEAVISFLASDNGKKKIDKLLYDISEFKKAFSLEKNIEFCDFNDPTKILVKVKGLSGFDLSDILFDEFDIEDELTNSFASLLLTGIGTAKHKLKQLEKALKIIVSTDYSCPAEEASCPLILPNSELLPREAFFAEKVEIPVEDAFGNICGETISEYPPGIPILILGEKISHEHINYLKQNRKLIKVVR